MSTQPTRESLMSIPDIFPHGNRRDEFAEAASALREVADKIERGEIQSALWVTLWRSEDGPVLWTYERFKARGVSVLELQGAMHQALHEFAEDNKPE